MRATPRAARRGGNEASRVGEGAGFFLGHYRTVSSTDAPELNLGGIPKNGPVEGGRVPRGPRVPDGRAGGRHLDLQRRRSRRLGTRVPRGRLARG